MTAEQMADEWAENGLYYAAEYLREHGVDATRLWIDGAIADEEDEDRLYHYGEGWVLENMKVAREMLNA